jgi:hypothetical protein
MRETLLYFRVFAQRKKNKTEDRAEEMKNPKTSNCG